MSDLVKRLRGTLADAARARFEAADCIEQLDRELAAEKALADKLADNISLIERSSRLRDTYHSLPNDKNRIGDKRSRKSHARDAWLRAFRKAASNAVGSIDAYRKARGM